MKTLSVKKYSRLPAIGSSFYCRLPQILSFSEAEYQFETMPTWAIPWPLKIFWISICPLGINELSVGIKPQHSRPIKANWNPTAKAPNPISDCISVALAQIFLCSFFFPKSFASTWEHSLSLFLAVNQSLRVHLLSLRQFVGGFSIQEAKNFFSGNLYRLDSGGSFGEFGPQSQVIRCHDLVCFRW